MYINFPYTDLYALNLDWILAKLREFEQNDADIQALIDSLGTVVNSVNGQSGTVTIDSSMVAGAKVESVYVAPNTPWTTIVGNITTLYNAGIRIIICGTNDRDLYVLKMSGNNVDYARYNPLGSATTFVESVNGQSGAISITDAMINATDINIFEWADPGDTINDYSAAALLNLYDNGIRLIFTQNSFGDYANMYALYKSGGAISYVAYEPTSAVAGVLSVNGMSGAVTITPADIGAVPTTTQVNGNPLSSDVVLTAGDVGAVPTTRTVNNKALSTNISLTSTDVGAVPTTRTVNNKALSTNISLTATDVGAVPNTREINGLQLSTNITLTPADIGAVPPTRKINNKALSSDIVLDGTDIKSEVMAANNSVTQDLTALKPALHNLAVSSTSPLISEINGYEESGTVTLRITFQNLSAGWNNDIPITIDDKYWVRGTVNGSPRILSGSDGTKIFYSTLGASKVVQVYCGTAPAYDIAFSYTYPCRSN